MNREVHVRIWERLEVRVLRATRQQYALRDAARDGSIAHDSGHYCNAVNRSG